MNQETEQYAEETEVSFTTQEKEKNSLTAWVNVVIFSIAMFCLGNICSAITMTPVLNLYIDISPIEQFLVTNVCVCSFLIGAFIWNPLKVGCSKACVCEISMSIFLTQAMAFVFVINSKDFIVPEIVVPAFIFCTAGCSLCIGIIMAYLFNIYNKVLMLSLLSIGLISGTFSTAWVLLAVDGPGIQGVAVQYMCFEVIFVICSMFIANYRSQNDV